MKHLRTLLLFAMCFSPSIVFAEMITAIETSRGEFEGGKFTPGRPEFMYRFNVDTKAGKAYLDEVIRIKGGIPIKVQIEYAIVVSESGSETGNFLSSENKRGKKILTLVGMPGRLATETIIIGEDFFEYSKAASGRFYLASGEIKR